MTQYIAAQHHQYTLYVVQVVADLAINQNVKICYSTLLNIHKISLRDVKYCEEFILV